MEMKLKKLPKFESEEQEREFWATHDSTEYLDWSKAIKNPSFPNLKRTEGLMHLVLPNTLHKKLDKLASQKHIPSERLAERFIREGMQREIASH
jgi:predicted HicB family RNase H-like nuclease